MAAKVQYCVRCVMPSTKPFLWFDEEGVCAACLDHQRKRAHLDGIDWSARKDQLDRIVDRTKARQAPLYDVVVPVSGGKDSIFQVRTALDYGLRVLAVNVDYGIKTEIGRVNLSLIPDMGATLITVRPEQTYHNQMIRIGLEDYGDPDLMSHTLLYAYPMRVAARFDVPVVFWGENSAFEYGGDEPSAQKSHIDREWFLRYVVTQGVTVENMSSRYGIPLSVLAIYDFPEEEIRRHGVEAIFLSHFLKWDAQAHLEVARACGFQTLPGPHEGTFRNYVGIDEKINRVHQYLKVLKFGYGRATDHACEEIRNGRMTREEAIELVARYDRQGLSDDYREDFAELLGYSRQECIEVLEKWRNKDLWRQVDGKWMLDESFIGVQHNHEVYA